MNQKFLLRLALTLLLLSFAQTSFTATNDKGKFKKQERHQETQHRNHAPTVIISPVADISGNGASAPAQSDQEQRWDRFKNRIPNSQWWFSFLLVLVGAGQVYLLRLTLRQNRPFLSVAAIELLNFKPASAIEGFTPLAVSFRIKNYGKRVAIGIRGMGVITLGRFPRRLNVARFGTEDGISIESEVLDAGEESSPCYLLYRQKILKDEEFEAVRDRKIELSIYGIIVYSEVERRAPVWRRITSRRIAAYSTGFGRIYRPPSGFQLKPFFDVGPSALNYNR